MKRPLRILHVLGGLDRGGAETMVMNLYRNIDREKVQFDFVIHHPEKDSYVNEVKLLGGKVFNIQNYKGINHLQYMKEWHRFFHEHPEYRIIHGHVRSTASIYLRIAKKYELITLSHSHNTSEGKGIVARVKRILEKPIRNIADYLIAPSVKAGEWLFGKGAIEKDNFYLLKNAIDTEKYAYNIKIREEKRSELNINNEIVIGHVGRFEEQKNHEFLIQIFKQFHKINNNSLLVLIGVGKLEEEIKKQVNNSKLENNVLFLGERADVNELMQAMDIFILPSYYEGLGIVAIESQTAGLPTIVSEGIPSEAYLTNLISKINLDDSLYVWVETIHKYLKENNRKDNSKLIKKNNYDIKETSIWLENFYLNII